MLVHTFRPTIFSAERRFELHDGTLNWTAGKTQGSVALRDIAAVRLYRQPTGLGQTMRRAVLRLKTGRTVVLQNTYYKRFGVIEERNATYRPFVATLLDELVAVNPQVKIVLGHSWALWAAWVAILIGAVVVLSASVLMALAAVFPLAALLYVGIVFAFVPAAWRIVKHGRPRTADPRALPAGILD